MRRLNFVLFVWLMAATVLHSEGAERVIAGYYTDWAQYRKYCQNYNQLDTTGFTHIILGFGKITSDYVVTMFDDWGDPKVYAELNAAKAANPKLKTLLALGGWNFCQFPPDCYIFPTMAASPEKRAKFIQSAISFCQEHGFDGIDFDWEYPEVCGSIADQANYVTLVKETKAALAPLGMLVTAALPVPQNHPNMLYKELSEHLDFINLMTYDLAGIWDGKTGPHTALLPASAGHELNVKTQLDKVLAKGVPKDKIVVGFGFYGQSFTIADTKNTGFGSAAWSAGAAGICTRSAGTMAWFEIAEWRKGAGVQTVYDDTTKTVYSYKDNFWISYDDPTTTKARGEWVVSQGLRGGMVWALDQDDQAKSMGKAMVAGLTGGSPTPGPGPTPTTYTWTTGAFGACIGECGEGTQTRPVTCIDSSGNTVDDSKCSGTKPWATQACTLTTSKCGANTECVNNKCVCKTGYTGNPLTGCTSGTTGYTWKTGAFSPCTGECGKGTQTRPVTCIDSSGNAVADSMCSGTKPFDSQACSITSSKCGANTECVNNKCVCKTGYTGNPLTGCTSGDGGTTGEYMWLPSEWSACQGYCGYGTQGRSLACVKASDKTPTLWTNCQGLPQPPVSQACKLPNRCKCSSHCECITWNDPHDLDPMCYNGECYDVAEVCALMAKDKIVPDVSPADAIADVAGKTKDKAKAAGSSKLLTTWVPALAGVALVAALAGTLLARRSKKSRVAPPLPIVRADETIATPAGRHVEMSNI